MTHGPLVVTSLAIEDAKLIRPQRFADPRGYFVESWSKRAYDKAGVSEDFVQDNAAYSKASHTVRGLHFQRKPAPQAKLVRAVRGSAYDVAVDLRPDSTSFGRYVAVTLTASGGEQLYIPAGFAHGYCTLEPHTEIAYKVSDYYAPEAELGVRWDDPTISIDWPLDGCQPVLSDRDRVLPTLAEIKPLLR
jgi:dTDP-4-dehydrorhamnose 3,5-epimerase